MSLAAEVQRAAAQWKWTCAYGVVLVAFGVIALGWPFLSAIAIGFFLGWMLCISGSFGIVAGLRARHVRGHWLDAAVGLLSLILGLLVLLYPLAGALTLLWTMSLWFAVSAVMEVAAGLRHRGERMPLILLGLLDILLSVLLFAGFARGDVGLVAILAGVSFVASGVVTILLALRLRDIDHRRQL